MINININQESLKHFNKIKVGDIVYGLSISLNKFGRPGGVKLSNVIVVESIKKINSFAYYEFIGKDIYNNTENESIYGNKDTAIRISENGNMIFISISDFSCIDDILGQVKDMIMDIPTRKINKQEESIKALKKIIKNNE